MVRGCGCVDVQTPILFLPEIAACIDGDDELLMKLESGFAVSESFSLVTALSLS